jgi:pimeloyl-ACP methyl ester carboxylesterase
MGWAPQDADNAGDVPLPASAIRILGQTPTPTATNDKVGDLILTLPAGAVRDITPVVFATNQNYYSFDVQVTDVNLQLAVDANRDGNITFDAADHTTADKPYRFWINDDQDTDAGDVTPVTSPDYGNDQIQCIRDLEDFARMNIFVQGITNEIVQGTFKIGLKWKNTTNWSAIKLWKNKSANGDMEYLTVTNVAQQHVGLHNPGYVYWTETYFIPTNFWQDMVINTTNSTGYLLFEGCSVGKGQLVLTINKPDGTEIAEVGSVWLDLEDISTMYEKAIVTEDTTGAISNWTSTVTVQNPLPAGPDEAQDIIVFVHGINVSLLDWYVESDTVFKRLFWSGYHGKFATVKWPCDFFDWTLLQTQTSVFNQSEIKAYKASTALANYLTQLRARFPGYRLHLLVHSQGNAVVSEAIRQSGAAFDTYILTQGAMPDSSYDVDAPANSTLQVAEFVYGTPEWQPMGYLGIYTNLPGRIVNFYNSLDPVLDWWVRDQAAGKPDSYAQNLIAPCTYYTFDGTYGTHHSIFNLSTYLVVDPQESRAMISRSLTDPIGQSGPESSHGVIQSAVDLHVHFNFGDTSFDDHSAQWAWPIQTTRPYFQQVLRSCQIIPAP